MNTKVLAIALAALGASAYAQQSGYVTQPAGGHVMNPFGLCWHSGQWTTNDAVTPCDATPRAEPAPQILQVQPIAAEPKLEPAPAPIVQAPAPAPPPAPVALPPASATVTPPADRF